MLKEYASYFVAYLLANLKKSANIDRVVLYGSTVRDEAGKESDIDIFIEVKKKTADFEKEVRSVEKGFYQSREAALFRTKGIDNEFSIKIGKLAEWKEERNTMRASWKDSKDRSSERAASCSRYNTKTKYSGSSRNIM